MKALSIRPFIGSKDFNLSRAFYKDLGFEEHVISPQLSAFHFSNMIFYLQNAYVKDWVDNTMVFVEVENVDDYLTDKYPMVRLVHPKVLDWGKECFVHDPSGILWHFGNFKK
jgi:hypothetical protein